MLAPADPAPAEAEGPPAAAAPATPPAAKTASSAAVEPVIRAPALLSRPGAADLARLYPDRAERLGVEGRTEMSCTVSAAGRAESCRLLSESPGDHRFGRAALELAKTFRFGGEVRIPPRWTLGD